MRYLEQQQVDIAILDIQMPAMDSLTLGDKIRDLPHYTRLPLIILSSMGNVV
ncbi:response regulator [Trichormus azollae]|uniref:response regulator n=1 Tax=Trichormus azollae TaxID=1164 RepID=UPI0009DAF30D